MYNENSDPSTVLMRVCYNCYCELQIDYVKYKEIIL